MCKIPKMICFCAVGWFFWWIFFAGTLIFTLGMLFAYEAFPAIIASETRKNLNLWNPESEGSKNFLVPPVPMYLNFYMFNVTNAELVSNGTQTPKLVQVGPYVYDEYRTKDIRPDSTEDNDPYAIRYGQYKNYKFNKEKSCSGCDAFEDKLIMPNAPLIGLVSTMENLPDISAKDTLLTAFNFAINRIQKYKDTLFLDQYTVDEFLFGGIVPGSLVWVNDLINGNLTLPPVIPGNLTLLPDIPDALIPLPLPLPGVIRDNGFAVFNGKNYTTENECYEINTGRSDMDRYLSMESWGPTLYKLYDDLTPANWWTENGGYMGSNDCNALLGTDGQAFAPDIKKEDRLWIFTTDLCRSMFLEFKHKTSVLEIPAYRFNVPPKSLATNTVTNLGFCMETLNGKYNFTDCAKPDSKDDEMLDLSACGMADTECPDGLLDITKCMGGAPVLMSSPYFLGSPDFLRTDLVDFPAGNEEDHETFLDIEPISGAVVTARKRLQVNIPLKNTPEIIQLSSVKDVVLPLLWLEEAADLDQENADIIKDMVINPVNALEGVQWTMVAIGAAMMLTSIGFWVFMCII